MAYGIQEPKNLAETLSQMAYSGLLDVSRQLVQMNKEGERDVATPHGMADTLADWAAAVIEEEAIEAKARDARIRAAKAAAPSDPQ